MVQQTQKAVQLLQRLIATPSVSREETAAADIIEQYLREHGCQPQRHHNNVWALSPDFDETRPTLLLNAHIDTVRPVSGWQHDPFTPTIEGDRLYGLGSNDCGGGLVTLLHVFLMKNEELRIKNEELKMNNEESTSHSSSYTLHSSFNYVFLASAEEEVSGKQGIESVLPLLPKVDVAIVGEPTDMQPAIAEKGLMVINAVAHGKAGHAARNEGINAIYVAMEDIETLRQGKIELESSPLLGAVKTTVTIIQAGTQHNVVPDECRFTIDVRTNECYTNEQLFDILQQHLRSELHARSFRLASSHISLDHPLVRRCTELGLQPFGSPTLSDQALMRFPSLKLGPGHSGRSHTADEFICLSEIDHAFQLYMQLLG